MGNNLPNGEQGYATSDLFEPHATIPDVWRVYVCLINRSPNVLGLKLTMLSQRRPLGRRDCAVYRREDRSRSL